MRVLSEKVMGHSLPILTILIHFGPGLIAIDRCGSSGVVPRRPIVRRTIARRIIARRTIARPVFEAAGECQRIAKHERAHGTAEESGHIRSAVRALDDDALAGHSPTEWTAKIIRAVWHLIASTGCIYIQILAPDYTSG
jgi:hypothetical protein